METINKMKRQPTECGEIFQIIYLINLCVFQTQPEEEGVCARLRTVHRRLVTQKNLIG